MVNTIKEAAVIVGIIVLIGLLGNMEFADAVAGAIG